MAGDITPQPKQGRLATPMSSLCILLCQWINLICCTHTQGAKAITILAAVISTFWSNKGGNFTNVNESSCGLWMCWVGKMSFDKKFGANITVFFLQPSLMQGCLIMNGILTFLAILLKLRRPCPRMIVRYFKISSLCQFQRRIRKQKQGYPELLFTKLLKNFLTSLFGQVSL